MSISSKNKRDIHRNRSAFLRYGGNSFYERVQRERKERLIRLEIFDGSVVNDSSWPVLLELFTSHLDGTRMRTRALCELSSLPQTTTLRYLDHLEKFGLVQREDDPLDQRITLVSLTEAGASSMRRYFERTFGGMGGSKVAAGEKG